MEGVLPGSAVMYWCDPYLQSQQAEEKAVAKGKDRQSSAFAVAQMLSAASLLVMALPKQPLRKGDKIGASYVGSQGVTHPKALCQMCVWPCLTSQGGDGFPILGSFWEVFPAPSGPEPLHHHQYDFQR